MNYGIKDDYWKRLETVFVSHKNIEKVILYGSRAKGTNRMYSDVDIVLVGEKINRDLRKIFFKFQDAGITFYKTDGYSKIEKVILKKTIKERFEKEEL